MIKAEILTGYGVPRYLALGGDMAEVPSRICGHLGEQIKNIYQTVIENESDLDKLLEEIKRVKF